MDQGKTMISCINKGISSLLQRFGYKITKSYDVTESSINRLRIGDTFVDSYGDKYFQLIGFRDLVVPYWREMFRPISRASRTKSNTDSERACGAIKQVRELRNLLRSYDYDITYRDILEIGCHDGMNTFAMIKMGAKHVDAIDIPSYGVLQKYSGNPSMQSLNRQSQLLQELRMQNVRLFNDDSVLDKVSFFDQDIAGLKKEKAYDLIVSWETLEHITNPKIAIENIYRALNPNGICFHEYNPFYAINGGHSLCTLDFPYGHARLSSIDFERYIQKYRPKELGTAMNFYKYCLNRMTIQDLQDICKDVGFNILALLTWQEKNYLAIIDKNLLAQCKRIKENVTISDLVTSTVWVVLQKPQNV